MKTAELVLPFRAELGEGINLFPDGYMRWVDLPHGRVYLWDGKVNHLVRDFGFEISKVLPWKNGMVVLDHTAVLLIDNMGNEVERINLHDATSHLRCSDGIVLPNGELLLGILDRDLSPGRGRFIRIHRDRSIETLVDKTTISNGVALLAGADRIAWVDSPTGEIQVFNYETRSGVLSGPNPYAYFPTDQGLIDGICADAEGGIWAALWRGSGVAHFGPNGKLHEVIKFSSPNVTSCSFDSNNDLLITTGTATLSPEQLEVHPGAGGLWRIPSKDHGATRLPIFISDL